MNPETGDEQRTLATMVGEAIQHGLAQSITDFTCWTCPFWRKCEFAFDPYNTDGDCLESK